MKRRAVARRKHGRGEIWNSKNLEWNWLILSKKHVDEKEFEILSVFDKIPGTKKLIVGGFWIFRPWWKLVRQRWIDKQSSQIQDNAIKNYFYKIYSVDSIHEFSLYPVYPSIQSAFFIIIFFRITFQTFHNKHSISIKPLFSTVSHVFS